MASSPTISAPSTTPELHLALRSAHTHHRSLFPLRLTTAAVTPPLLHWSSSAMLEPHPLHLHVLPTPDAVSAPFAAPPPCTPTFALHCTTFVLSAHSFKATIPRLDGNTALHIAVSEGNFLIEKFLIEHGAGTDNHGWTLRDLADHQAHEEIIPDYQLMAIFVHLENQLEYSNEHPNILMAIFWRAHPRLVLHDFHSPLTYFTCRAFTILEKDGNLELCPVE